MLKFDCFGSYVLKCWLPRSLSERIFIVIFMKGFRMTKLQIWGMSAALAASMVVVLSAVIGTAWSLGNAMGELQGEIRVLTTREEKNTEILSARMTRVEENMEENNARLTRVEANTENLNVRMTRVEENTEGLKEKVNSLEVKVNRVEVEVRSTNEYLRKSENQDVPKDTSASDLTPVTP